MTSELNLPPIIGICGGIGAGKDTVADALAILDYRRLSFASPLKSTVVRLFPHIPADHFCGTQEQKAESLWRYGLDDMTGRRVLEIVGSSLRAIDPDVWVRYAMRVVDGHQDAARWVFPDVRYQNEVQAIRERGGVVWRVVKIGHEPERTGHESDAYWEELDVDAELSVRSGAVLDLKRLALSIAINGGS